MRQVNRDLTLMCKIQASIFEKSIDLLDCSSPIFIKNYMQSDIARSMDDLFFLNTTISDERVLQDMNTLSFGSIKYTKDQMHWMGYFYRYVSYIYEIDSKRLLKVIPGTMLIKYYIPGCLENIDKVFNEIVKANNIAIFDGDYLFKKTEQNIKEMING